MRTPSPRWIGRGFTLGALIGSASLLGPGAAAGQGCMPVRFASQVVGAKGDVYLPKHTWQVGLGYRRATSNQKVVGHVTYDVLPNGKIPSVVKVNTVDVNLAYGVSERLEMTLDVPFANGSHTTNYADGKRHENTATGLGDVSLVANYWLKRADALQPGGNLSFGVGLKTPTGKNDIQGTYWNADGTTAHFPVHPSIELGDGGWGAILQIQGFQPFLNRVYLYAAGSYTLSTKETTDVPNDLGSPVHWAVPDTWDARAGAAMVLWPEQGLSASLGVRFDGTPRRDLIGGQDDGDRLPATAGFLEPGLTLTSGRHTMTLSVPLRIYKHFRPNYLEAAAGDPGGGGLSRSMVMISYSVRP